MHDPPAVAQAELSPNLLQQTTNTQTTTFETQSNGSGASRKKLAYTHSVSLKTLHFITILQWKSPRSGEKTLKSARSGENVTLLEK